MADYDIPVYPGTMRYNPQVKDHGIIIGCLVFHGLLMTVDRIPEYPYGSLSQPRQSASGSNLYSSASFRVARYPGRE